MTIQSLARDLAGILGAGSILTGADTRGYADEETRLHGGRSPAIVLRPRSADSLSKALQFLAMSDANYVLTARSGGTSLKGGSVPARRVRGRPMPITIDLSRLSHIRVVESARQVVAEAGRTLQDVDNAASTMGRSFGVQIGPQETAQVGGSVAIGTTSGDWGARRGTIADQLLAEGDGLVIMLADGQIITSPQELPAGLRHRSLKDLFCGTEGAYGLVIQATFNTWPRLTHRSAAILEVADAASAMAVARRLDQQPVVESLELMSGDNLPFVCGEGKLAIPRTVAPFHVLVEAAGTSDPTAELMDIVAELIEDGLVSDAAGPSENEADRERLWAYRKWFPLACNHNPPVIKFDVRFSDEAYVEFVQQVRAVVRAICPDAMVVIFGHLLGRNLHINVLHAHHKAAAVEKAVYALVLSYQGLISHEHGYGRALCEKRWGLLTNEGRQDALQVKAQLDPRWRLNRGVWVPARYAAT